LRIFFSKYLPSMCICGLICTAKHKKPIGGKYYGKCMENVRGCSWESN